MCGPTHLRVSRLRARSPPSSTEPCSPYSHKDSIPPARLVLDFRSRSFGGRPHPLN